MKKRTFYIVNLDRNRIMLLSVLLTGFILLAFATGYRFGHTPGDSAGGNSSGGSAGLGGSGFSGSLKGKSTVGGMNADQGKTSDMKQSPGGSSRYGKSIYDLKKGAGGQGAGNTPRREKNDQRDINGSISMDRNRDRVNPRERREQRELARKKSREREAARRSAYNKRREAARRKAERRRAERRRTERRKQIAARKEAERKRRRLARDREIARLNRENDARRRRENRDRRTALLRTRKEPTRSFRNTSPGTRASGRTYTVQVGAYRMKRSANRIASTLKRKGFGARVRRHRGHYFVMVGRASSKNELRGLRKRLRQEKYPSFIIPAK